MENTYGNKEENLKEKLEYYSFEPPQVGSKFFVRRMKDFIEEKSNPSSPSILSLPNSPNSPSSSLKSTVPLSIFDMKQESSEAIDSLVEKSTDDKLNEEILMDHSYEDNTVTNLLNNDKPIEIEPEIKTILNSKLPPLPAVIRRKTSNVSRPLPRVPTSPGTQSEISKRMSFSSPPILPQKKHSSPVKEPKINEEPKPLNEIQSNIPPPPPIQSDSIIPPPPPLPLALLKTDVASGSIPPPPPLTSVVAIKPKSAVVNNLSEKPKAVQPVTNFMDEMKMRFAKINPPIISNTDDDTKKNTISLVPAQREPISHGVIPPPPSIETKPENCLPPLVLPTSNIPPPPTVVKPISSPAKVDVPPQINDNGECKMEPLEVDVHSEESVIEEDELVEEVLLPSTIALPEISPSNFSIQKIQSSNRLSLSIPSSRKSVSNSDDFMEETLRDLRLTETLIDETIKHVSLNITKENVKSHRDCLMNEKVPLALDRILSNIMKANDYLRVRFDEIDDVIDEIGEQCNIISKEPQMEKRFYTSQNNKNRGSKMMEPDVPFRKKSTIDLQSTDFSSEEHRQVFSRVAQIDLSFPSYYQVLKNVGTPLEFEETELYTINDSVATNNKSALYSPNYNTQQQRKSSNSIAYLNSGSLTTRSSRSSSSESSKNSFSSFTVPTESPVTVGLYNNQ